jgi:hypothetical protein
MPKKVSILTHKDCSDYTTEIPRGVCGCINGQVYKFCINPDAEYLGCEANLKENKCPRGYK